MSKAFTKDDADDAPLVVAPRPPLPDGVPNYVTARGMSALREEHRRLEAERARLDAAARDGDPDRAREAATVAARLLELDARIASARLVDPDSLPHDAVRFGARVTVRDEAEQVRHYQIVGVDEADAAHGLVAFVAPLARALLGKHAGEVATVRTPHGPEELEVIAVEYDAPSSAHA